MGGKYGVPVVASDSGKVTQSGISPTGEGRLSVAQPNGESQTYRDIKPLVLVGTQVHEGDIIGVTDPRGTQTAAHLHYETKINGVPYDPFAHLPEKISCP